MKMEIVSIFDQALAAFARPFFVPSIGIAMRSFQDEVNRPDGEMRKHPEDYALWHLASWDDEDGLFQQGGQPVKLTTAEAVYVQK